MSGRLVDEQVSREGHYSLGRDQETGAPFLSVPVSNRMVDYEEYYRLTPDQYRLFSVDASAARDFADECRKRSHDGLLILQPGTDRGVAA